MYTQRFNRRHKTDGPPFRGRFKSKLIKKEAYLLELVRYIHLNPVKAGNDVHGRNNEAGKVALYLIKK